MALKKGLVAQPLGEHRMEPEPDRIRQVAFAIGFISLGLSIGLFLVDLATLQFTMAFRMLAPALLQAFSLYLFHDSRAPRKNPAISKSASLPHTG